MSEWFKIGKIGKAHGLRGAFFVSGRDEIVPKSYGSLLIGSAVNTARPAKIIESLWRSERPLLLLDIATDRTSAETLTGQDIWVRRQAIEVDPKDEYLWRDLEDRAVLDAEGEPVGHLEVIYNSGASDIAVVVDRDGRRLEIALISDYFDLSFPQEGPLNLVVNQDIFEDLWQEVKP